MGKFKKLLIVVVIILALNFVLFRQMGRILNRSRSAPPYQAVEATQALHRRLRIADMHDDSLMWRRDLLTRSSWGHVDVPRLIDGNVAVQGFSVVTENTTPFAIVDGWPLATWMSMFARAQYQASKLHQMAEASGGKLVLIKSREDLSKYLARRNNEPGLTAGFLSLEGAQALDGDPNNLDRLFDAGFRMIGITHFSDNELGGSSSGRRKGGLTDLGRTLIERMEKKGVIIDLAHASPQLVDDVLNIARRPVIVSHTGVQGNCAGDRNLSDAQLRRIAQNGGLVGIGYWDGAICGKDVDAIVKAIRYAVTITSVDNVCLGSDFDGAITAPFDTSGLVLLTEALLRNGFTEDEVKKIMGENAIRLLETGLP
ncbi:MAG TPA: dipeptidase [Pyrinomonadaceae bacterium]